MRISFNWLKDYVKLPDSISPEAVAEQLKLSTVEVESVENLGAQLESIVVGKILKCVPHPDADKLKVCDVDLGLPPPGSPPQAGGHKQIVCGGSNVAEGMLVAVAKIGAKVKWHGEGELVTLEKATIRGVESSGMICGADEIGLGTMFPKKDEKEILDLTTVLSLKERKPGAPIAEALKLNDAIFEIDNKSLSNRPDLWGHYGIAREVAALNNRAAAPYAVAAIKPGKGVIKVEIENAEQCPRYMAVAVDGVTVGPSPAWLQQKLIAVGQRPINSVVDITNFVMLDIGQPLHAFDAKILQGDDGGFSVGIRGAKNGEKFITLDEKERDLPEGALVITSNDKPVAIAGIMGGLDSGVQISTATVVFEAANFNAALIRKTSTALGLRTDASARFEKNLDPSLCELALSKAVKLLLEISPGAKVVTKIADAGAVKQLKSSFEVQADFFTQKIGVKIPKKTIIEILGLLGFTVKSKEASFEIFVPSWRARDIDCPEAIVEEVLRIYGYQNIPGSLPAFPITPPEENKLRTTERRLSDILVRELACAEVYNYSFVSAENIKNLGDEISKYLELDNPLSKEKPFLRRHLLNNLLENVKNNIDNYSELRLFEIGRKFLPELSGLRVSQNSDELLPREVNWLTAVFAGKKNKNVFGEARGAAEAIFRELNMELKLGAPKKLAPWLHPARSGDVVVGGKYVGSVFELHPKALKNFNLDCAVAALALNLDELAALAVHEKKYEPISEFPAVQRDLAFVIGKEVSNAEIVSQMSGQSDLLKKVELFDVYEGVNLLAVKKSVAYRLTFVHPERTLTTSEINEVVEKIKNSFISKWGVEFR